MSTLTHCADTIGFKSISNWFKRLGERMEYNRQYRATINELRQLTDKELNDIGLSRGDIISVARGDSDMTRKTREIDVKKNSNLEGWV